MHKLLERQIRKLKRISKGKDIDLGKLLEVVSQSYEEHDRDRRMKDRSIELMSEELLESNKKIRERSETYISAILENVVDGVLTIDNSCKLISLNEAAEEVFGYTASEIIGESFNKLIPRKCEEDECYLDQLLEDVRQSKSQNLEIEGVRSDGDKIPLELSISDIILDNQQIYIAIVRNISVRKESERALVTAKEKAEEASMAKAVFLSTMSHEIRTPMNAVIGMTNLLLQEEPLPHQLNYLKTLKFSADNLLALINDILDFSKIDAGKITFENVEFSLKALIGSIKGAHEYMANEKGVAFKVVLDYDLPNSVIGDPIRLGQILNNLVNNAVKFTEEGSVTLSVHLIQSTTEEAVIEFEVKDTGIGITKDKTQEIFKSFTQSSSEITRRYGGTGLGLAITKNLIELQGGSINVESKVDHGSRFYFTLAFQQGTGQDMPHSMDNEPSYGKDLRGIKLLLVEDNEVNHFVAKKFLEKWNVQVDHAVNGVQAMKKLESSTYDIVLMDLQMPEMDGYETTIKIRGMDKYKDLPIVALTASAMLEIRDKVFEVGMNDFVSKPFNPDELYQKISKNLPHQVNTVS